MFKSIFGGGGAGHCPKRNISQPIIKFKLIKNKTIIKIIFFFAYFLFRGEKNNFLEV